MCLEARAAVTVHDELREPGDEQRDRDERKEGRERNRAERPRGRSGHGRNLLEAVLVQGRELSDRGREIAGLLGHPEHPRELGGHHERALQCALERLGREGGGLLGRQEQRVLVDEVDDAHAEEREAQARSTLQEAYRALEAAEERLIWARARAEIARAWFELAKEGELSLAEEKARLEARLLEVEEALSIERAEKREEELTRRLLEEYENQDERGR